MLSWLQCLDWIQSSEHLVFECYWSKIHSSSCIFVCIYVCNAYTYIIDEDISIPPFLIPVWDIYILKNLCAEIWETKAHWSKIQLHLRLTLAIDSCSRPALRTPTPHGEEKTLVPVIHAHRWNLRHHPGSALGFPGAPAVSSHGFVLVKLRGPTRHYCDDLVRKIISWQRNRLPGICWQ